MTSLLIALGLAALTVAGPAAGAPSPALPQLPLTALDGAPLPKETLAGHVVLVVNVASQCGYTPQYKGLEALYQQYKDQGLVLVGVPCNQFGGQEPGTAEEIRSFCTINYGVTFPLLAKAEVNGPGRSDLYTMLVTSPAGGGADIKWNFEKFLIGRDGQVKARFKSAVTPEDPALRAAIEAELAAK